MNVRAIRPGDRVLVDVKGVTFEAVIRSKAPRVIGIDPVDPIRFTWRYVSSRQIRERLERPSISTEKEVV